MFGLQKIISVLPVLLGITLAPGSSDAEVVSDKIIRIDSHVTGHVHTMWNPVLRHETAESGYLIKVFESTTDRVSANVVEMSLHDAVAACDRGDLNLLPLNRVLPEGSVLGDYIWNGIQPCSVGHSVWVTYAVFDTTNYVGKAEPAVLQDFFNTKMFPGKRAIKKSPKTIAEWILLSSGVARRDIYSALSTAAVWPLIKETLQNLGPEIIWVNSDREALQLLDSGEATFAMVSSQNLVRQIAAEKNRFKPAERFGVIWNGAVAHMSLLAVPKNSATDGAIDFLRYITDPVRNLQMSTALGYAPVSRSQTALIDYRYRQALPVNAQTNDLLWGNEKWWREKGGALQEMFSKFTEQFFETETAQNKDLLVGCNVKCVEIAANYMDK